MFDAFSLREPGPPRWKTRQFEANHISAASSLMKLVGVVGQSAPAKGFDALTFAAGNRVAVVSRNKLDSASG